MTAGYNSPPVSNLVSAWELGKALMRLRKEAGLTQTGLADKSGLSRYCVMRLEQSGSVSANHLFAVIEALGMAIDVRPVDPENTAAAIHERFFADLGFPSLRPAK